MSSGGDETRTARVLGDEPEVRSDHMAPEAASRLASVIGDPRRFSVGEELPLLWHWAYFPELAAPDEMGYDGHPRRRDELVDRYPRRMAGGSRIEALAPFRLGTPATRRSHLASLSTREGRRGPLAIASYVHTYAQEGRAVRLETQTVLYRGPATRSDTAAQAVHVAEANAHSSTRVPLAQTRGFDPVLLFRFSAATWNAHRIHYDRAYATGTEGYPGLVVHGPLLAVILTREVECVAGQLVRVTYRMEAPVFDGDTVRIGIGREDDASWHAEAVRPDGQVAVFLDAETGVRR